ncbi:uncharacterized protein wu:fa19b12 isoform X1 [Triplophysa dalaica]|uniref:uncharacterized protein wu:fa19b12 isoform X1 n=1 Tax=Triplophysa dalaica TaxID=1582913 RepID=UPI0024DF58AE|nr:uncharacterized protein wu:fa19b12 isoform X1 [Triplophysa dalaica]
MTKRRAENALPPEIATKRCLRSLFNIDDKPGGVTMVQNGNVSVDLLPLLSCVGQRCRKRPNYNEDSHITGDLPRKAPANRVNSALGEKNTWKSRKVEDAGKPVAPEDEPNKKPNGQNAVPAGDKVMHTDDGLSAFNSFQFWRVPLPELDFSLLEPTDRSSTAISTKDLEAMET